MHIEARVRGNHATNAATLDFVLDKLYARRLYLRMWNSGIAGWQEELQ